jgi:hydroxypyruvate isomerase
VPRFAANVSWLWPDLNDYERFRAAARAGFRRVEMQYPQKLNLDRVEDVLGETGLELVLFNQLAPDGILSVAEIPGKGTPFLDSIGDTVELARRLGTKRIHIAYGAVSGPAEAAAVESQVISNLKRAAPVARLADVQLVLEPVNQIDRPGIYPDTLRAALAIVRAVDDRGLGLQVDTYHAAMNGEDLLPLIADNTSLIGHVQIADFPGRHEPGTGGLPLEALLSELDRAGYDGAVGLEYRPTGDTDDGLRWLSSDRRG